jgi:hypothetical protein
MPRFLLGSMTGAAIAPLLALSLALPAQADPLLVSASGVFTDDTPLLPFSAPGAAWSFSFVVDRNPVPIDDEDLTLPGFYFTTLVSDFRMLVNGAEIEAATHVAFYSGPNLGGMDLVFGGIDPDLGYQSLGFFGDAYYSGSELAPTIEPGSYVTFGPGPDNAGVYVTTFGDRYWQPPTTVNISAVPNPASAALMFGGLAMLALRRRSAAAPA